MTSCCVSQILIEDTLFDNKRNEEILEELKVEPADDILKRYKSN